ncbi:hypothetical protein [Corynebacterium sp. AOP12-C2-36]|uniref:hypothetical protein n=1 Tax=Corynebacterium sp. AOP12-C2-36 TaxID=3457723 RepID=UPI0040338450
MPNEAAFDRDQLASGSSALRSAADDIDEQAKAALTAVLDKIKEETSVNTRDGNPAPIYSDIITQLQSGITNAQQKVGLITQTLRGDATTYDQVSTDSAAADDAGSTAVNDTETDTGA